MQPIQDRSYRATCEANFCHANVGVGDGRRSLSNVKNLGSLDLQVLGSGTHSDLSVNDAAMGYQLNFSANGQLQGTGSEPLGLGPSSSVENRNPLVCLPG